MRILLNTNQPNIIQSNFHAGEKETISNPSASEKINNHLNNTSSVTIAALAIVCCFFMLSKGVQKNTNKYLNKFKEYLEKRSAHSSLNESGKWEKFYEFSIRRINSFIKKSESINNITSLKDILFMRLMYKTKPTKSIHEKISNYFEKVSHKTVTKSYKRAKKSFDQMNKTFDDLDEYILKNYANEKVELDGQEYTKGKLIEKARSERDLGNMAVYAFLDEKAIKERYNYINKVTSSLYSTFWNDSFKDFWSKNNKFKRKEMWQTFIAAEHIKGNKTDLTNYVSLARNAVTYSNSDQVSNIKEYIKALDSIMPANDKEGIEIIKKLEWLVKNPEIFQNNKKLFFDELKKMEEHKFPLMSDSKIGQTLEEYKQSNINLINKQIDDNEPGMMQKMLSYYYVIAPFELEKSGALTSLKRAVKLFDEAVNIEEIEYFDKVRDLKLGSAPTDILTIILSFITLSLGFGHAKDKDQRHSIMLKSGIPIVGGIATSMYSATKLVSGGKSLALGFLSGIMLNRIGVIVDNIRKNKNNQSKQPT